MAKQSKDVFNISPLSTIALSTEAAIREAQENASTPQSHQPASTHPSPSTVPLSPSNQGDSVAAIPTTPTTPATTPTTPPATPIETPDPTPSKPRRNRGEVPMVASLSAVNKQQRINRTFTITATNDQNLGIAAARLGMTKSAILEQLFEQWWNEYTKK